MKHKKLKLKGKILYLTAKMISVFYPLLSHIWNVYPLYLDFYVYKAFILILYCSAVLKAELARLTGGKDKSPH